jgi:hypothetical protein
LSADEVWLLSMDAAIADAALNAECEREREMEEQKAARKSGLVVPPIVRKAE